MDVRASLEAECDPQRLFGFVDDLGAYEHWVDLVHRAERVEGADDVWQVELRARIGPLARSKRLRMRRVVHDPDRFVVEFHRDEVDGKQHAAWVMRATVTRRGSTSLLEVHLHYGGALWTGGVLERALAEQITNGRERLTRLVDTTH